MVSSKKILVIGESCKDVFIYGVSNRLAPEAPAPVFTEVSRTENPGMAMNVKRNVNSLGIKCDIWTNENWESITKTRYIDDRTNHMFLRVDCNDKSFGKIEINEEKLKKIADYDVVIISDYNKGLLSDDDIRKISKENSVTLLDSKRMLGSWCQDIKYIKINSEEYQKTKNSIYEEIHNKLIITLGKEGCTYRNQKFKVDNVSVKDVAGAGDTFVSALAVSLIHDNDLSKAIKFANNCATKVVQKRGVSIPDDNLD